MMQKHKGWKQFSFFFIKFRVKKLDQNTFRRNKNQVKKMFMMKKYMEKNFMIKIFLLPIQDEIKYS